MNKSFIVSARGAEVEGRVWTINGQRVAFISDETKELTLTDAEAAGFRAMGFEVNAAGKMAAEAVQEADHE